MRRLVISLSLNKHLTYFALDNIIIFSQKVGNTAIAPSEHQKFTMTQIAICSIPFPNTFRSLISSIAFVTGENNETPLSVTNKGSGNHLKS